MIIRDIDDIKTVAWLHPSILKDTIRINSKWGSNCAKNAENILIPSIEKVKRT